MSKQTITVYGFFAANTIPLSIDNLPWWHGFMPFLQDVRKSWVICWNLLQWGSLLNRMLPLLLLREATMTVSEVLSSISLRRITLDVKHLYVITKTNSVLISHISFLYMWHFHPTCSGLDMVFINTSTSPPQVDCHWWQTHSTMHIATGLKIEKAD